MPSSAMPQMLIYLSYHGLCPSIDHRPCLSDFNATTEHAAYHTQAY
jgi:hypothetical protein